MSCVNKGNQIVSDGFYASGRDWVVDLETDGLSREGRPVSQGLLLVDSLGLERGLLLLPHQVFSAQGAPAHHQHHVSHLSWIPITRHTWSGFSWWC